MNDIPAMTDKQCVIEVLQKLPDDASLADIREEAETILAILESEEDILAGRVYSHEEVKEEAFPCISKSGGQLEPVSS